MSSQPGDVRKRTSAAQRKEAPDHVGRFYKSIFPDSRTRCYVETFETETRPVKQVREGAVGTPLPFSFKLEDRTSKQMDELSIREFVELFTEEYCREYLTELRYKGKVFCGRCGHDKPFKIEAGKRYKCGKCNYKFSILVNTVFENSKNSLRDWFYLIYQMAGSKKNISSVQTAVNLGVEQATAWNISMKIRQCMRQVNEKLSGVIEIDESYISKAEWSRWGGVARKTPVLGMLQRGGPVILISIPDKRKDTIIPIVTKYVEEGATVYTDGHGAYQSLTTFIHDYVEHTGREWVRGDVHTNSIENVWSFFKKNIRNAHHST